MQKEILGLRTIIYHVSDLEKAKQWYSEAFGVAPYFDEPFYVGFNIGGYELGLHPGSEHSEGGVVAYWGVNNVDEVYNKFLKLNATEYEKPTEVGGGIIVATVKDSWNNLVGLIYNPLFKVEE